MRLDRLNAVSGDFHFTNLANGLNTVLSGIFFGGSRLPASGGEDESLPAQNEFPAADDIFALLALDLATKSKRRL